MTTAHRATWKAAVGRSQESSGAVSTLRSIKDAPAHTKLKVRATDGINPRRDEIIKQSLKKLQEVENRHKVNKVLGLTCTIDPKVEEESRLKMIKATAEVDDILLRLKYDDGDNKSENDDASAGWSDVQNVTALGSDLDGSDSSSDGNDSDEDSEDDEAALQAELAKIRAEREMAKSKVEAAVAAEELAMREEAALVGNPLLNSDSLVTGKLKRRWNDDVVFRNQAKGEPEDTKRFINDTVRNDFHKRFLRTHFR